MRNDSCAKCIGSCEYVVATYVPPLIQNQLINISVVLMHVSIVLLCPLVHYTFSSTALLVDLYQRCSAGHNLGLLTVLIEYSTIQ